MTVPRAPAAVRGLRALEGRLPRRCFTRWRGVQDSQFDLAVESLGSLENVDGEVIADTLGIDMDNLTRDVVVVISWVAGFFALVLISTWLRPMLSRMFSSLREKCR